MNSVRRLNGAAIAAVAMLCWPCALAVAQTPAHGRVSYDVEGTCIMGRDDADWSNATLNTMVLAGDTLWVKEAKLSEIELAAGTYLRLADRAKVEIVSLEPDTRMQGWTGSFYLHRLSESTGNCTLASPATDVSVAPNSLVRVDIDASGGTTIYVLDGEATIGIGTEHLQTVGSGLQVYVEPGHLGSQATRFDELNDDFDIWNRERVALVVGGYRESADRIAIDRRTLGAGDLASSGRWIDVGGEQCWQPEPALGYVPYRDGYWSSVAGCGDVWVGRHAFEYTTSHYGRWNYFEQHGWLWRFDAQWSPAWVASVKYGPSLVWSPLGFDNLPVRIGAGASFSVGDVQFSLGACSFVPVERVYYGYEYIRPVQIDMLQRFDQRDIQIWNIDVNNIVLGKMKGNWKGYSHFKGKPEKRMRGLATIGVGGVTAREVVMNLSQGTVTDFDFKSRGIASGSVSVIPAGHAKRAVKLDSVSKSAKAPAGPGKKESPVKAKGGDKVGTPDKAKGNDKSGPPEKAKGSDKSGTPDKAKGGDKGGAPEKAKGGSGNKAKGGDKGGAPEKAKGGGENKAKGGGKDKGGGSKGKSKG